MIDEKAAILMTINPGPCGVRELVEKLSWKTSRVVSLLKAMENEGLVDFREGSALNRGRPKKLVVPTTLGHEFLESFKECQRRAIQINQNDIKSAVHQAHLARKLEEYGVSPYQRFIELMNVAFKVRDSVINEESTKTRANF